MKAFIIYLPTREHSVSHASEMYQTLKDYNFDVELFEGTSGNEANEIFEIEGRKIYPYGIKTKSLSREEIRPWLKDDLPYDFWNTYEITMLEKSTLSEKEIAKISKPGVKGCFYSHYRLWRHCLAIGEPIAIFEDDVKFFRGYIDVEFEDILVVSLGKSSFLSDPWKTFLENPSGDPKAIPWKNYSMPGASGYVIKPHAASALVKFYRNYYTPADNAINKSIVNIQIHNYIMGRNTLPEEGNISMTKAKDWL